MYLRCLQDLSPVNEAVSSPTVQVNILDGAAVINMLRPGSERTFQNYCTEVFLPYITSQLQHVSRLDIIWDVYVPGSLKTTLLAKGERELGDVLSHKMQFLGTGRNFFALMITRLSCSPSWQDVWLALLLISRLSPHLILMCSASIVRDVSGLAPCTHEEADTRILLHLEDAV